MFASIIYHLVKCFRRKTFEPILVKIRGNIPFFISNEWSCNIKHILFTKRLKFVTVLVLNGKERLRD